MDEKNGFTVTLTEEERKAANRERQKRYYERHKNDKEYKDKRAEYGVKYRANHKEELAVKKAEWYQQNKEKILAYSAEYRAKHKDEILAKQAERYQKNKDKIAAYRTEYRANNKGKILEQRAEYRSTPFGRAACLVGAYRLADKKYNRGECTIDAQWIVDNIFTQSCHYCGESDWHKLGCDRIDNSLPHTPDNVVPCCSECNIKKQKTPYDEFMRMIGKPV